MMQDFVSDQIFEACKLCGGTGISRHDDGDCWLCKGTGKVPIIGIYCPMTKENCAKHGVTGKQVKTFCAKGCSPICGDLFFRTFNKATKLKLIKENCDGICANFQCDIETCIHIDMRYGTDYEDCEGCMRCAICEYRPDCIMGVV